VQQLVFLRFLTGLGIGGVMANAVALASEYSPQRQRASHADVGFSCGFTGEQSAGGLISAALIRGEAGDLSSSSGGVMPLGIACRDVLAAARVASVPVATRRA